MRSVSWICLVGVAGLMISGCARNKADDTGAVALPPAPAEATQNGPGTTAQVVPPVPPPTQPEVVPPANTELIVTPDTTPTGKVAKVNANARYVVVSFPIGTLPPVGRQLNVYRDGLKVAELTVTGPQRNFNTIADIKKGECQVGDQIRED